MGQLHLSVEGLTPDFNKEVTEYYIVVPTAINKIDVEATPEDSRMSVEIVGNNELKPGKNVIQIKVFLPDTELSKIYNVNVSKTDDEALANNNLESLAIENVTLIPEFSKDILEYRAEVGSDVDKLNILATAENINAIVTIEGNDSLKYGDNEIVIKVLAEDGVTEKSYRVLVYKKTIEEDRKQEENETFEEVIVDNKNKWWIWLLVGIVVICLVATVYLFVMRRIK